MKFDGILALLYTGVCEMFGQTSGMSSAHQGRKKLCINIYLCKHLLPEVQPL